jgi:bacteriocin-like protein
MTNLNNEVRELNNDELDAVSGGKLSDLFTWAENMAYWGPSPDHTNPFAQNYGGMRVSH